MLVFASDIASAALDHDDPEASAIFGDGAAAVAIERGDDHALLASRIETYGEHADLCRLEAGGTRLRPHEDLEGFLAVSKFRMDGPQLFRATAKRFPGFLSRLLEAAGITPDAIDTVIPHQASAPAIEHLRRALNIPGDRVIDVFATLGNRIAASMPHALHLAIATGCCGRGRIRCLSAARPGFRWAGRSFAGETRAGHGRDRGDRG